MRTEKMIYALDLHTLGEPVRVVMGGMPPITGETMISKMRYFSRNLDDVRRALILPPRGSRELLGAVITESCTSDADLGVIFMDASGYLTMCGDATIAVVTVAFESGLLKADAEEVSLSLDVPAGLIGITANVVGGKVTTVRFVNVPAFVYSRRVILPVSSGRELTVDIAFGGNFCVLVSAEDANVNLEPAEVEAIKDLGHEIKTAVNDLMAVNHPQNPNISSIELVMFYQRLTPNHVKNATVFGERQLVISPCGTGTSAFLALLTERGELPVGESLRSESLIGTSYYARAVENVKVGEFNGIVPELEGTAYLTGIYHMIVDPEDPVKCGYLL